MDELLLGIECHLLKPYVIGATEVVVSDLKSLVFFEDIVQGHLLSTDELEDVPVDGTDCLLLA